MKIFLQICALNFPEPAMRLVVTDQKNYPDKTTICVELVLVSTQNLVLATTNLCPVSNLELWNPVQYNLFSSYLACIKDVEVFAVFLEAVIAVRSWVAKCLFLVRIAALPCSLLLVSALAILL